MRALPVCTLDPEITAQAFYPLAHPTEPQMTIPFADMLRLEPRPAVRDLDNELILLGVNVHSLIQTAGMPEGVVQSLLDKPVHSDFQGQSGAFRNGAQIQVDLRPGAPFV